MIIKNLFVFVNESPNCLTIEGTREIVFATVEQTQQAPNLIKPRNKI